MYDSPTTFVYTLNHIMLSPKQNDQSNIIQHDIGKQIIVEGYR